LCSIYNHTEVAESSWRAIKVQQNVYNDEPVFYSTANSTHIHESLTQNVEQTIREYKRSASQDSDFPRSRRA